MAPDTVTFKNCFKIRKQDDDKDTTPVPHSFNFMARQDLPNQGLGMDKVERIPRAMRNPAESHRDIFALVKSRMASTSLAQDPLLCMPGSLQAKAEEFIKLANREDCPKQSWKIEDERRQELSLLCKAIKRDYPHMHRACAWYASMDDAANPAPVPDLAFLRSVIGQRNLGDHIISIFPEKSQLHQAIDELVNTEPPLKRHLTLAPNASTDEFWLGLGSFDYTPEGKNGCRRKAKKEEEEDRVKKEEEEDEGASDDDKAAEAGDDDEDFLIRDIRYKLETELSLKDRGLKTRSITWVFEPETVYGKRDGTMPGIAIISRNSGNLFKQTKGWKTGTIHSVPMLARNSMYKPDMATWTGMPLPHLGRAFTDVQEMRQAAGGTGFIHETLKSFSIPTSKATILVDLYGYDGALAMASLEDLADGKTSACGTMCLDNSGSDIMCRLGNTLYSSARAGRVSLTGFPDISPIVASIKSGAPTNSEKTYKVTSQVANRLMILQSLATKFIEEPTTKDRAEAEIASHNERFNKDGQYLLSESNKDAEAPQADEPAAKRVKLEECTEQHVSTLKNVGRNQFLDKRELLHGPNV
ncbi:unnamed protein product [Durusdinium trenchii]|uniref:Uncharacterized protein n=1 Tax=Durusdinium trenchii TaxID=1381693 RepID=A0ABP0IVQ6_9DINO